MSVKMLLVFVLILPIAVSESTIVNISVNKGEDVSMTCADVSDECRVAKLFTQITLDRINTVKGNLGIRDSKSCVIELRNVSLDDVGVYKCDVDNGKRVNFNVFVYHEPEKVELLVNGDPIANDTTITFNSDVDRNVTIKCRAEQSSPKVVFSWYVDGLLITERNEKSHATLSGLFDSESELVVNFECEKTLTIVKCDNYHKSYLNDIKSFVVNFKNVCSNGKNSI